MPPAAIEPKRSNQMRQSAVAICRRNTNRKTSVDDPNESGQRLVSTSSLSMFEFGVQQIMGKASPKAMSPAAKAVRSAGTSWLTLAASVWASGVV